MSDDGENYTLADLAADADAPDPDDGGGGGDSFLKALQFVDDRVGLDRLAAAQGILPQEELDGGQAAQGAGDVPAAPDGGDAPATTDGGEPTLNAENIAQFGKVLLDARGDVSISQVVMFAENNPERVNQAISEAVDR